MSKSAYIVGGVVQNIETGQRERRFSTVYAEGEPRAEALVTATWQANGFEPTTAQTPIYAAPL